MSHHPDFDDSTMEDAESALKSVDAMVELLDGYPANHKISAGAVVSLLVGVKLHLQNVVGDLRTAARNGQG